MRKQTTSPSLTQPFGQVGGVLWELLIDQPRSAWVSEGRVAAVEWRNAEFQRFENGVGRSIYGPS